MARRTTLLLNNYPYRAAVLSGEIGRALTGETDIDGELTNSISHCEVSYLQLIHETQRDQEAVVYALISELTTLARICVQRRDQKREASVRVMLADLLLHVGQVDRANREMASAIVAISSAFDRREDLSALVSDAFGEQFVDRARMAASGNGSSGASQTHNTDAHQSAHNAGNSSAV